MMAGQRGGGEQAGAAQRAERPRAPGKVAAFMSAHSKTPYVTTRIEISSREGVVRGRRVQQLAFALLTPQQPAERRPQAGPLRVK